jgi:hypothetical protein
MGASQDGLCRDGSTTSVMTTPGVTTKVLPLSFGGGRPDPVRIVAEMNYAELVASGYLVQRGWNAQGPPVQRPLLDHPYRLTKDQKTIYVSEPYGFNGAALGEWIVSNPDWSVEIAQLALWYPGCTTPIRFESTRRGG